MEPEVQEILRRAHDNGGTVRLRNTGEARSFIVAYERGYIVPHYDQATLPPRYLHHMLTHAGREALIGTARYDGR